MARRKHAQPVAPCQPKVQEPLTPPPPDEVRAWLDGLLLQGIKVTLETPLEQLFLACLHARPYERTAQRQGYRNGFRPRDLVTRCGRVEDVPVPRDRAGTFDPVVFERWQRIEAPLEETLRQMYLEGVSTRKSAPITAALCQEELSASAVSRLNADLSEKLQQWGERPLTQADPSLYLDAIDLPVNWGGQVVAMPVLVAVGVNEAGDREILAVTSGDAESGQTWRELLRSLKERGLHGVRLVISDAHSGLKQALREVLPLVDWQRCVVHFERNILSHVPPQAKAEVGRALHRLFAAETAAEARAKAKEFAQTYQRSCPQAVTTLQSGLEDALTFLKYPDAHQRLIRTNNGLERTFREVRRRTDVVSVFIAGENSCVDLVSAGLMKVSAPWSKRRYLDMSLLSELSKNEES